MITVLMVVDHSQVRRLSALLRELMDDIGPVDIVSGEHKVFGSFIEIHHSKVRGGELSSKPYRDRALILDGLQRSEMASSIVAVNSRTLSEVKRDSENAKDYIESTLSARQRNKEKQS